MCYSFFNNIAIYFSHVTISIVFLKFKKTTLLIVIIIKIGEKLLIVNILSNIYYTMV